MILLFRKMYLYTVKVANSIIFTIAILFIVISAFIIVKLEPKTFSDYLTGVWWVVTTVTTVGYGDVAPKTDLGRIFGMIVQICGVGLIGLAIGKIFEVFSIKKQRREEGKLEFDGSNHVIIIGWSDKADYSIQEILNNEKKTEIVVIDTLEKSPYLHERIHYINGNPSNEEVLKGMANIEKAKSCFVFADEKIEDKWLRDCKTFMVATAVERITPEVFTIAELELEESAPNFSHLKVDKLIYSNKVISNLAFQAYKGEKN
jgi:voltage-gated potassium channel